MNYEMFKTDIVKKAQEILGDKVIVKMTTANKNNLGMREMLAVIEGEEAAVPVVPLMKLYEIYLDRGYEECVNSIRSIFQNKSSVPTVEEFGWNDIKDKVYPCLINTEWNEKRLQEIPHIPFLDLSVVYRCRIRKEEYIASFELTNQLLEFWGITEAELHDQSMENLETEGMKVQDIYEIMGISRMDGMSSEIYVASNTSNTYGAAVILKKDLLNDFADRFQSSFWILPSSVHELLFIPDNGDFQAQDLKKMVCEVNVNQVEQDEWLSEGVYYFDMKEKGIRIAA